MQWKTPLTWRVKLCHLCLAPCRHTRNWFKLAKELWIGIKSLLKNSITDRMAQFANWGYKATSKLKSTLCSTYLSIHPSIYLYVYQEVAIDLCKSSYFFHVAAWLHHNYNNRSFSWVYQSIHLYFIRVVHLGVPWLYDCKTKLGNKIRIVPQLQTDLVVRYSMLRSKFPSSSQQ